MLSRTRDENVKPGELIEIDPGRTTYVARFDEQIDGDIKLANDPIIE